ncbi:uncharacterized protein G2W53_031241 [Senna tora]|uniref:Uncharacterized protein n=1 Tax=Senna tora TaxID=362788 RepID=A0A834T8L4_9FABA|nr:uncharacterized protein G2W53_031241 [Senna tora]
MGIERGGRKEMASEFGEEFGRRMSISFCTSESRKTLVLRLARKKLRFNVHQSLFGDFVSTRL